MARGTPARLFLWGVAAPTVEDVRQMVAQMAKVGRAPALVAVDHLGWMGERPERGETLAQMRGRQSRGLKTIGKRYGCAMLLVAQLNRGSETGDGMRKPVLSDLRDSGELEQDGDLVILLHRESRETADGEFIIAKQRNGPTGATRVKWNGSYCRWETVG